MANLFPFEVHTPYRRFFSDEVEAIALTLIDGEAAVYANHSAFTAPVCACALRIKGKDGTWKTAFTAEGVLEVKNHKTVLMSDAAEWPEEIDYERAKAAKERAEKTLAQGGMKFETDNASSSFKRAAVRMKVREIGNSQKNT
ncbi:ATP synthase F1 subunit epsilon [Leadbettera azotonutricia]|uniref:ATP synthase epsilon chain n=1 Tax=Leadbettera azotonutricia (strain ATCC BAA-888 / DSM 13862 / ZAS-9) TaxID=545695 RepID=F5YCG3_LEAAZ|nr:ATP synthase F1 subunit epsilon [Leadbettera azotonutricia]AEF81465.1 ATP synthase F1, epsilon subunit [Leadbettera azotonutricia ZAS-9]